jgi:hypothetical protein
MSSGAKMGAILFLAAKSASATEVLPVASTGCLVDGQKVEPPMGGIITAQSYQACQKICSENAECKFWHFHADMSECQLGNKDAKYEKDEHCVGAAYTDENCKAGPKECEEVPSWCSELPDPAKWPGKTVAESEAAWTRDLQPPNMQCWPKKLCGERLANALRGGARGSARRRQRWLEGRMPRLVRGSVEGG